MRNFAILLGIMILGGCSLMSLDRDSLPERRYYSLSAGDVSSGEEIQSVSPIRLGVRDFGADSLIEKRMITRISPVEIEYREYELWASRPEEMVTAGLKTALAESGIFYRVSDVEAICISRGPSYMLDGYVHRFELDSSGSVPEARLEIELTLVRDNDGEVIFQKMFKKREPLTGTLSEDFARAMNRAFQSFVREALKEISSQKSP